MVENIVPQTPPTYRTWADDGSRRFVDHPLILCPACETYCGALIESAGGVCLGCAVEWDDQIAQAEARYEAEQGADLYCACGAD